MIFDKSTAKHTIPRVKMINPYSNATIPQKSRTIYETASWLAYRKIRLTKLITKYVTDDAAFIKMPSVIGTAFLSIKICKKMTSQNTVSTLKPVMHVCKD